MENTITETPAQLCNVSCNICGSSNEKLITIQNRYRIVQCNDCDFVYVNPRPDNETLKHLYLKYLPEKIEDPLVWKSYMGDVFEKAAKILIRQLPKTGRVLDIGCGYGFFLSKMKEKKWQAYGMDVSETAISYAKKHGIEPFLGTLDNIQYADNYFDAITLFYVLEHLPDPLKGLKEIKRILKPNGILLLRVPYTTPIVKTLKIFGIKNNLYDPPFHLNDFSPKNMHIILKKAGFDNPITHIGGFTNPPRIAMKATTFLFGIFAEVAYKISLGKFILPGVAYTAITKKG